MSCDLVCPDACGEASAGCDASTDTNATSEGKAATEDDAATGLNRATKDSISCKGAATKVNSYTEGVTSGEGSDVGLPVCSCLGIASEVCVYAGNPAESKNVYSGEGVKVGYSIHSGDVEAGVCINTGVGITIRNHDGVNKRKIAPGEDAPTGLNNLSAVFADTLSGVIMVVGLITM